MDERFVRDDYGFVELAAFVFSIVAIVLAGWAGWSAHRSAGSSAVSAEEARRARLDQLSPRVTLIGVEPRHERWIQAPFLDRLPDITDPGVEYVVPRQEKDLLLIGAEALFVNEGTVSAVLTIEGRAIFVKGVGHFPSHFQPGEDSQVPQDLGPNRYLMRPQSTALLIIRDGRTVKEWTRQPKAQVSIVVRASSQQGETEDSWTITVEGDVLEPIDGDAGRWRVVGHTPTAVSFSVGRRNYGR